MELSNIMGNLFVFSISSDIINDKNKNRLKTLFIVKISVNFFKFQDNLLVI